MKCETIKYDVLIGGVGGQGTILASRLLAAAAIRTGLFTRTAETIGMSQRGGSVTSHVRIGSKGAAPVIPLGQADLLIGFEPAEAARNLPRLASGGTCIINTHPIMPVTASLGSGTYHPQQILEYIRNTVPGTLFIDGYTLAQKAGSVKAVNVILLGAAASTGALPFSSEVLQEAITQNVPSKFVELNKKAFQLGFEYSKIK